MYTIVGLGNPGEEYEFTRHNVGWLAVESFLKTHGLPNLVKSGTFNALLSEGVLYGTDVGVLLPTTFMNNSGHSVVRYQKERKRTIENLIVVHDEVDLPLGTLRISVGRNGGGHNGVASVIDACGSAEFIRVRIGIAKTGLFGTIKRPTGDRLSEYVLGNFTARERVALPDICKRAADAISLILEKGVVHAMNQYN